MVVRAIQKGVIINMHMYVKKFKRKCGVRGCKNISDVYVVSRRREMGNTVAICRECMVDALKSTDGYVEEVKAKSVPKQLFPHPELLTQQEVTLSSVTDDVEEPKPTEVIEEVTEDTHIHSVTEDTVAKDFFDAIEKTNTAKPKSKVASTTPNKTKKSSKKKK